MNRCPFCKKLFSAELVSKQQVDESELSVSDMPHPGTYRHPRGGLDVEPSPVALVAYRLNYRCKHCGKEWNKISKKEIRVPKDYTAE